MSEISEKVRSLTLRQFTAFEEAAFEFSPGINVLMGANSTGKTHVMKVVYAVLRECGYQHREKLFTPEADILFPPIFRLDSARELIRSAHLPQEAKAEISLAYGNTEIRLSIRKEGLGGHIGGKAFSHPPALLYLPSHEFLSISQGFIAAYEKRELPYDSTYYHLALALNALPLRKEKIAGIREPLEFLHRIIIGKNAEIGDAVTQNDGRFYFHLPEGKLDASIVSEGYRKIATLYYLLRNGSLAENSVLLWDEPEANLNPQLIVKIAKVLRMLALSGIQIFVATHDYLLSHELSLLAEYPSDNPANIRFFALNRSDRASGVSVESGQTLAEISHNPILEEFAAHYDRESELFHSSETTGQV